MALLAEPLIAAIYSLLKSGEEEEEEVEELDEVDEGDEEWGE